MNEIFKSIYYRILERVSGRIAVGTPDRILGRFYSRIDGLISEGIHGRFHERIHDEISKGIHSANVEEIQERSFSKESLEGVLLKSVKQKI